MCTQHGGSGKKKHVLRSIWLKRIFEIFIDGVLKSWLTCWFTLIGWYLSHCQTMSHFDYQVINWHAVFQVFNTKWYSCSPYKRAIAQTTSLSETDFGGRVLDSIVLAEGSLRSLAVASKLLPNASSTQGLQVAFRVLLITCNVSDLLCPTSDGRAPLIHAHQHSIPWARQCNGCRYARYPDVWIRYAEAVEWGSLNVSSDETSSPSLSPRRSRFPKLTRNKYQSSIPASVSHCPILRPRSVYVILAQLVGTQSRCWYLKRKASIRHSQPNTHDKRQGAIS